MNRSSLRTRLRRRIQEETADYFTDAALNIIINEALSTLQTDTLPEVPDLYTETYLASVVSGQEMYAFPAGMLFELLLEIKDTSANWRKVRRVTYEEAHVANITGQILASDQGNVEMWYGIRGQDFALSPIPSYSQASSLRLTFVNTLSMDDDTDVPAIPYPLHKVLLAKAEALCLTEMGESYAEAEVEYQQGISKVNLWLRRSGAASVLNPGTPDIYSNRSSRR